MSVQKHTQTASALSDRLEKRLGWAIAISIAANFLLWAGAAAIARHPPAYDPQAVEITRIVMDTKGHKVEKVITKKQIEKKVAHVVKEIQRRKPEWKPPQPRREIVQTPPRPAPRPAATHPQTRPLKMTYNPPQGAHNRILTAPDITGVKPDDHAVLPGGNADVGKPTGQQNPGNAVVNPPQPIKPEPVKPAPPPPPPLPPVKNDPPAPPVKVEPTPIAPPPPPPVKIEPKVKGPTRDAEPQDSVNPEIPEDLKHGDYKAFVRVRVEINEDGSFTPVLRTSSGNAEIDQRVLEALKRWRWKPALKDGIPQKSVKLFKFEFEVQ